MLDNGKQKKYAIGSMMMLTVHRADGMISDLIRLRGLHLLPLFDPLSCKPAHPPSSIHI